MTKPNRAFFSNQVDVTLRFILRSGRILKLFEIVSMSTVSASFRNSQSKLTQYFLTSFESIGLSVQEKKHKTDFLRWRSWWPSWISNRNKSSYFFIYRLPRYFLLSFESTCLSVQKKKRKIDFQDGVHHGHLGFPIGTVLAIFGCKSSWYFLLLVPVKKFKIDFQDGRRGGHVSFQIGTILAIFNMQVLQSFESVGLSVQ